MLRTCGGQALPCPAGLPVPLSGVDLPTPPPALSSGSFLPFESWAEARAAPSPTVSSPHCAACQATRERGLGGGAVEAALPGRARHLSSLPPCAVPSFRPAHRPLCSLDWCQPPGVCDRPGPPGGPGAAVGRSGAQQLLLPGPQAGPALSAQSSGARTCSVEPAPGLRPVFASQRDFSSLGFVSV